MTKAGIELLKGASQKARDGSGTCNQLAAVLLGVLGSLDEKDNRRDLLGNARADLLKLSIDLALVGGVVEATATNTVADE